MTADAWSGAIDRMLGRIQDTAARVKDGFPHWADPETGQWTTTPEGDWTGSFWIGQLWLAAAATGDARYRSWAAPFAERLRARIDAQTVFKANRCEFIVGSYYLFESLLGLAGRIDPLRV
ncbi:MAG: hypothetical protein HYY95_06630 [Candidatus Rokubacteria bacterium]|nr:hypothetical protein [Candidatus Rokubacteria bacterium]